MNYPTIGIRSLRISLNLLAECESRDEIKDIYQKVKGDWGCKNMGQLIHKIKDVLVSNGCVEKFSGRT